MGRMACVALAAVILLSSVIFGQKYLHDVLTDIAESADRVCVFLAENKGLEGEAALQALLHDFERHKKVLLLFLNDVRVHELHRSVTRSLRLVEVRDFSPALEAMSDFAASLRELADTHHPTAENVLKVMNLSQFHLDKPP